MSASSTATIFLRTIRLCQKPSCGKPARYVMASETAYLFACREHMEGFAPAEVLDSADAAYEDSEFANGGVQ